MTFFELAATISACDSAMILEGVPQAQRDRVLKRFSAHVAQLALNPPQSRAEISAQFVPVDAEVLTDALVRAAASRLATHPGGASG